MTENNVIQKTKGRSLSLKISDRRAEGEPLGRATSEENSKKWSSNLQKLEFQCTYGEDRKELRNHSWGISVAISMSPIYCMVGVLEMCGKRPTDIKENEGRIRVERNFDMFHVFSLGYPFKTKNCGPSLGYPHPLITSQIHYNPGVSSKFF